MSKLIRQALYTEQKSLQHMLRENRTAFSEDWSRAAVGLKRVDPDTFRSYELLQKVRKYRK